MRVQTAAAPLLVAPRSPQSTLVVRYLVVTRRLLLIEICFLCEDELRALTLGWLGGGAVSPCLISMNACHPNMGVPRRGERAPRMALCVRICTRCVDHASYKTCSALYCVRRAVCLRRSLLRTHLLPLSPPVCRVCPVIAGSSSYAAVTNTQTSLTRTLRRNPECAATLITSRPSSQ